MRDAPPADGARQPGLLSEGHANADEEHGHAKGHGKPWDGEEAERKREQQQEHGHTPALEGLLQFLDGERFARGFQAEKLKIGGADAVYQEVSGTLLKKTAPFDPNAKTTPLAGYKQLYVVFEKDGITASAWLRGPEKTVDKHRKAFDEWVKAFK